MTDNEIIKALECCIKHECTNCSLNKMFCSDTVAMGHALDLTKRQQKEIERLKIENQSLRSAASSYKLHYNKSRVEAIKEFAKRLKENISNAIDIYYNSNGGGYYLAEDTMEDIDNLAKEMIGDTE